MLIDNSNLMGTGEVSYVSEGMEMLEEVESTLIERGTLYGPPVENFDRIAKMWSVLLNKKITPNDVARMMVALKLARSVETPDHRDDYLDMLGYVVLGWDLRS